MKAVRGSSVLAAALCALLLSCGGDSLTVAGVGTEGTGFAAGTVTGFGSIIVDGDRWNDSGAIVEFEETPRQPPIAVPGGAGLGQRLSIDYTTDGVAERVRIDPALVGTVESPNIGSPTTIRIAGQEVRVNFNPDRGPVTFFSSFPQLMALLPGSIAEVHGALVWDAVAAKHVIEASRIEKLAALPAGLLRVNGVVSDLGADGFRLGDLAVRVTTPGTLIVPANRALASGQSVTVWGSSLSTTGPLTLTADAVRIRPLDPQPAGASTRVSGTVSRFDSANARFELAGITVSARDAIVVPANLALADGQYAIVRGRIDADRTLRADQVRIRRKLSNEPEVELTGTITDFVSDASFRVRGTRVDASAVSVRPSCPPALANGVVVSIEGSVQGDVVRADKLSCR